MKKGQKHTKPLRKIVREYVGKYEFKDGTLSSVDTRLEELECGHVVRQKEDIYGPTNAYSRRCNKCPDITPKN